MQSLCYSGKIINLEKIPNSDYISSATVVCGHGGKWKGVVRTDDFNIGDLCFVYLPDAILPDDPAYQFLKASGWRVKMQRFRGVESEVLILPDTKKEIVEVGLDYTVHKGVKKYEKSIPILKTGKRISTFPDFVPKTDETHYQRINCHVKQLEEESLPFYITQKCDGTSATYYRTVEKFGACSRNQDLEECSETVYWQMAYKYGLNDTLPLNIALQGEICGPDIQSNPMGLTEHTLFAFSAYDIEKRCYLEFMDFVALCARLRVPMAYIWEHRKFGGFTLESALKYAKKKYTNGKPQEGVVVRSQTNVLGRKPISFKVINLDYQNH